MGLAPLAVLATPHDPRAATNRSRPPSYTDRGRGGVSRVILIRESALRRLFPGYRVLHPSTWHEARVTQMWNPDDAAKIVRDPNTTVMLNHLRDDEWVAAPTTEEERR